MKQILRMILGWVAGVITATAAGVFLQTQNVIARLKGIGAEIGFADRIGMTAYDLIHLGSLYVIFVSAGMLVAFLAGGLVYRLAGFGRWIVYAVAGAVAMLVMLMLMKQAFFGVHLIAGARDAVGLGFQMLAGAAGGLIFAYVTRPRETALIL